MIRKNILLLIIIFLLSVFLIINCDGSKKQKNDSDSAYDLVSNKGTSDSKIKLDIPYKKLKSFFNRNFIPVFSLKASVDKDIDEEVVIAYKFNNNDNINVIFFELLPNNIIKKKFEFQTLINDKDSFSFQCHNLFDENDISFIIEGKSIENKWLLYILNYDNDVYKTIDQFSGDYSIIIDYQEEEFENKKYLKLKEITTVDNSFSETNTNIQQKKVYIWDYTINKFKLVETSQIFSSDTSINRRYLTNGDSILGYIKGFWYPEKYETLIKSNKLDPNKYNSNNIEFIFFSNTEKKVQIKFEDYMSEFSIQKIDMLWGQSPGVRLKLQGFSDNSKFSNKKLEVYLLDSRRIQVTGPNTFDDTTYVRLARPFVEYIKDKKAESIKRDKKIIFDFLNDEFINNNRSASDEIIINFLKENQFVVKKGQFSERGVYKLTENSLGVILTFLFDKDNTILKKSNYIIKISDDYQSFSLKPVKLEFSGFVIEDLKVMIFEKRTRG